MIEIRLHGRGGQGAVTAAELVAQAAIASDKYAQGFPNFGPERRGAPVMAFLRVSQKPIYLRERIDSPDVVIVLDHTLLGMVDVTEGLKLGGTVIINITKEKAKSLREHLKCYKIVAVDASKIAMETLGCNYQYSYSGALIRSTEVVTLDALDAPVRKRFGRLAEKNLAAMKAAFNETYVIEQIKRRSFRLPPSISWDDYLKEEAIQRWDQVEIGCDINETR